MLSCGKSRNAVRIGRDLSARNPNKLTNPEIHKSDESEFRQTILKIVLRQNYAAGFSVWMISTFFSWSKNLF